MFSSLKTAKKTGGKEVGGALPCPIRSRGRMDGNSEEDLRRLVYVGMTRAKKGLYISYAKVYKDNKEQVPGSYYSELKEYGGLYREVQPAVVEQAQEQFQIDVLRAPDTKKGLFDRDFVTELVKDVKLSATGLNNYINCPLSFYFQNIIRMPSARNQYMGFGNAMHYAMQYYFKSAQEKGFGPVEDLVFWFEKRDGALSLSFYDGSIQEFTSPGQRGFERIFFLESQSMVGSQ